MQICRRRSVADELTSPARGGGSGIKFSFAITYAKDKQHGASVVFSVVVVSVFYFISLIYILARGVVSLFAHRYRARAQKCISRERKSIAHFHEYESLYIEWALNELYWSALCFRVGIPDVTPASRTPGEWNDDSRNEYSA